jgi:hypothetical protein
MKLNIVDMKTGTTKFLVHWKGYSPIEWTWEPLQNLSNCTEFVDAFKAYLHTK